MLRTPGEADRDRNRGARRDALLAGQPPRITDRLVVRDLLDGVNEGEVQVVGNEARADAVNLMACRLERLAGQPLRQDWTRGRLDRDRENRFAARPFDIPRDSRDRAAVPTPDTEIWMLILDYQGTSLKAAAKRKCMRVINEHGYFPGRKTGERAVVQQLMGPVPAVRIHFPPPASPNLQGMTATRFTSASDPTGPRGLYCAAGDREKVDLLRHPADRAAGPSSDGRAGT